MSANFRNRDLYVYGTILDRFSIILIKYFNIQIKANLFIMYTEISPFIQNHLKTASYEH